MWLFILGSLLATTGTPVSASCPLELSPRRAAVAFGGSLSVNCSSTSPATLGMGWETPLGGIGYTDGASFLPLKIDSVNIWNLNPICYTSRRTEGQCTATLPVTVYKMPDRVSMSQLTAPMIEGTSYRIQCNVDNFAPENLTLYMRTKHEVVNSHLFDAMSLTPVNRTFEMDLVAHRGFHGLMFWCEVRLNLTPHPQMMTSRPSQMLVLFPPAFHEPDNVMLEESKSEVSLNCTASGNPAPTYTWEFPHPIEHMEAQKRGNRVILDRYLQFPGNYSCTASNSRGSTTKYFTIVQAPRNLTTFAAILGTFAALGVVLFVVGLCLVTPDGTFSLNKGGYVQGQPAQSRPI